MTAPRGSDADPAHAAQPDDVGSTGARHHDETRTAADAGPVGRVSEALDERVPDRQAHSSASPADVSGARAGEARPDHRDPAADHQTAVGSDHRDTAADPDRQETVEGSDRSDPRTDPSMSPVRPDATGSAARADAGEPPAAEHGARTEPEPARGPVRSLTDRILGRDR